MPLIVIVLAVVMLALVMTQQLLSTVMTFGYAWISSSAHVYTDQGSCTDGGLISVLMYHIDWCTWWCCGSINVYQLQPYAYLQNLAIPYLLNMYIMLYQPMAHMVLL